MTNSVERLELSGVYDASRNSGNRPRRSFNPDAPMRPPMFKESTSSDPVERAKALIPTTIRDLAENNRQSLVESMIG